MSRAFMDTNVLVYAFSTDRRQRRALDLLERGGVVSVQSLNEFANAARRKLKLSWAETRFALTAIKARCSPIVVLDEAIHLHGLDIAERHRLSIYDGMIAAAAIAAHCGVLYSEDMHAGLVIDDRLTVVNPFAA